MKGTSTELKHKWGAKLLDCENCVVKRNLSDNGTMATAGTVRAQADSMRMFAKSPAMSGRNFNNDGGKDFARVTCLAQLSLSENGNGLNSKF